MIHEVVMPVKAYVQACNHLLQAIHEPTCQEDLCFALWRPSTGNQRYSAIVSDLVLPMESERELHGNVSFDSEYLRRALLLAYREGVGLAFMHSHPTPGWQGMSEPDVVAEKERIGPPTAITELPLVGLTMGSDGSLSARFWHQGTESPAWCAKVRVAGGKMFRVTYKDNNATGYARRTRLQRTVDSWGPAMQQKLARLRVGVVGVGSVGTIIAEMLARMGFEHVTLIDADKVEEHNLDRMIHAREDDIGKFKVELVEQWLRKAATASNFQVLGLVGQLQERHCYQAALDCDILFSCVDRPLPKDLLNNIAYAHCIPVIFGGVYIASKADGRLAHANWTVSRIASDTRCLRCDGQYTTSDVMLEVDGSLDNPTYVHGQGSDWSITNQNVISFSTQLAGTMVNEMVRYVIAEDWWPRTGSKQTYRFISATLDSEVGAECRPNCAVRARMGYGDYYQYPFVDTPPAEEPHRPSIGTWIMAKWAKLRELAT